MSLRDNCPLHKDILDFWTTNGKEIKSKSLHSVGGNIVVYFHGEHDGSGYPPIHNVIAYEYHDGSVTYRLNGKNLKEAGMLRMINLKSFL